jgi:hypothetical protein
MLTKQNSGYAYYLLCIDCFTRKIFVQPIKKKTAQEVIEAFRKIFKGNGHMPWKIITDQGKEFVAGPVQSFFKRRQIEHFCNFTSPVFHAGMAERANRTLKERLYRYFTENSTNRWVDVVQQIVDGINASPNRSIGNLRPKTAHLFADTLRAHFRKESNSRSAQVKFEVGQRVRIANIKSAFEKGYKPNFSDEIYTVNIVRETAPITYGIVDNDGKALRGWFYEQELCPVFSQKMQKLWEVEKILEHKEFEHGKAGSVPMLLVKWKNRTEDYNSWIPSSSVQFKEKN